MKVRQAVRRDRFRVGFHGDLRIVLDAESIPDCRQNGGELVGRQGRGRPTAEVYRLHGFRSEETLLTVEAQFGQQGTQKFFRGARMMDFEIKSAEMAPLVAEGHVNIEAAAGRLVHGWFGG